MTRNYTKPKKSSSGSDKHPYLKEGCKFPCCEKEKQLKK
jgi:hypothetical protein